MKHTDLAAEEEKRREINEQVRESFNIIVRECDRVISLLDGCLNTRQIKNEFRAKKMRVIARDKRDKS